jgi:hypothetical protein
MIIIAYVTYYKNIQNQTSYEKDIQQIQTQSSSSDIKSIEKDLEETNLYNLDKELDDIEKELDQVY